MTKRKDRVDKYLGTLPEVAAHFGDFLTDELADVQPMTQRIYRDKASGDNVLKLVPHWTSQFCPYPAELCGCGSQTSTTIGRYDESGDYTPRKGFEEIEPVVVPE
jgi:hypothetical protein